jgi:hypothetical protein
VPGIVDEFNADKASSDREASARGSDAIIINRKRRNAAGAGDG